MEIGYIWEAHSIPLSMLYRLIPILSIKSKILAPASRPEVPRASIDARSRKKRVFPQPKRRVTHLLHINLALRSGKNDSRGRKGLSAYS